MNKPLSIVKRKEQEKVPFINNQPQEESELESLCDKHPIWRNKLISLFQSKNLSLDEARFIFSQYYYYSKNFTKLIAAGMVKCDNSKFRSELSQNLWEEGGELDIEKRHSKIFEKFITETLGIEIESISYEDYTKEFFNDYLSLILNSPDHEALASLAFATEGIVPRLYSLFIEGLLSAGIPKEKLHFFYAHIEFDDEHAKTLRKIALSYKELPGWQNSASHAIQKTLDIRHRFFNKLYDALEKCRLTNLISTVLNKEEQHKKLSNPGKLKASKEQNCKVLYENCIPSEDINFIVNEFNIPADTIQARLLSIAPHAKTERHKHAHESVFFVIEGEGSIQVGNRMIELKTNDVVYVPRWISHQTSNISNSSLKILAITDYELTGLFRENQHQNYRRSF